MCAPLTFLLLNHNLLKIKNKEIKHKILHFSPSYSTIFNALKFKQTPFNTLKINNLHKYKLVKITHNYFFTKNN
ncbi:hypothetical protein J2X17_002986 [Flavobacterium aquidurense]|nr:hypothetical protein [Flavobacterium aquidurense]